MKDFIDMLGVLIGTLIALSIVIFISWGIVGCFLKLIALCFGINISIGIITGIWLILVLIKLTFL